MEIFLFGINALSVPYNKTNSVLQISFFLDELEQISGRYSFKFNAQFSFHIIYGHPLIL